MQIRLLAIGKTEHPALETLMAEYSKRLSHYTSLSVELIPALKKTKALREEEQKEEEGKLLLKKISQPDLLYLLDERGKQYSSVGFADFLQQKMNSGTKSLVFCIGGPYGFTPDVYQRAQGSLSLSPMTFSHQMVRPIFLEQLYRAFTILRNEPYHHQ
jgi:23S rRNA (pseudouridine1915-N3)-methyltransferase